MAKKDRSFYAEKARVARLKRKFRDEQLKLRNDFLEKDKVTLERQVFSLTEKIGLYPQISATELSFIKNENQILKAEISKRRDFVKSFCQLFQNSYNHICASELLLYFNSEIQKATDEIIYHLKSSLSSSSWRSLDVPKTPNFSFLLDSNFAHRVYEGERDFYFRHDISNIPFSFEELIRNVEIFHDEKLFSDFFVFIKKYIQSRFDFARDFHDLSLRKKVNSHANFSMNGSDLLRLILQDGLKQSNESSEVEVLVKSTVHDFSPSDFPFTVLPGGAILKVFRVPTKRGEATSPWVEFDTCGLVLTRGYGNKSNITIIQNNFNPTLLERKFLYSLAHNFKYHDTASNLSVLMQKSTDFITTRMSEFVKDQGLATSESLQNLMSLLK